jgi:hypothetical protein
VAKNVMEESKNPYPIQKITRLFGVCLLIGVIAYFLTKDVERISVSVQDDHLSMSHTAGDSITIRYEDILSITKAQALDLGKYISGTNTERYRFGVWENDEFGKYHLCVYASVSRTIVIETSDGFFVFNLESNDATDSFFKAFQEMLESE